ncbi:MAG: (d)CMP kinase [Nocardioides sp.]|uniref:(d)CMP kinase n=1 Tax=Nocardioides sp. TaxID=35761 RepID=UPI0039E38CB1
MNLADSADSRAEPIAADAAVPRVVVAIDGTSGSGKSSTARGVAARLGMRYLDTGAMYRAMTWWMLQHGIDTTDPEAVAAHAPEPVIEAGTDPLAPTITLDGVEVSTEIRSARVNAHVSPVATVPAVRARLVADQQEIIRRTLGDAGIVVEGRDIASVVWPDAEVRLFLSADPAARARRRAAEEGGTDELGVRRSLEHRDRIDSTRGGLELVDGATTIDTTDDTLEQVIDRVTALVRSVGATA